MVDVYSHAETHLPATKQVKDMLVSLLGREVTLTPVAPLTPKGPRSVAVYVDDRLGLRAVIACDLEFSARCAAALALMPPRTAEEAIENGFLDDTLSANLYEVSNIAASMFNVEGAAHVRLLELHPAGTVVPAGVLGRILTLGRREDLEVDISGYGTGRYSVVICG